MSTISHREMRNNSAEILRRVEAGEIIEVTNNGVPAAVLVPVSQDRYQVLLRAGRIRRAVNRSPLSALPRVRLDHAVGDDLDALRGDR